MRPADARLHQGHCRSNGGCWQASVRRDRNLKMPSLIDKTGSRYGKLVVLRRVENRGGFVMWECKCDCGTILPVAAGSLSTGNTKTCGCGHRDANVRRCTKHGMSRTSEHAIWAAIIDRCTNPKSTGWNSYGGRGIKMCEEWQKSFLDFYRHVGPRPSVNHSIDRINNQGNYEPGNVRWSTAKEQCRNKRSNRLITYEGKTMPLCEWAEKIGIPYNALRNRLNKGWSTKRALTEPKRR